MAYYYQARKKKAGVQKGVLGIALILAACVLLAALAFPNSTGRFGAALHQAFFRFAGGASFLVPIFMGWLGGRQFMKENSGHLKGVLLFLGLFLSISSILSLAQPASGGAPYGLGGWAGGGISLFLLHQFGTLLSFTFSFALLFLSGTLLLRISPLELFIAVKKKIQEDLALWREERKKIKEERDLRKKLEKAAPAPALKENQAADESKVLESVPSFSLSKLVESRLKSLAEKSQAQTAGKDGKGPKAAKENEPARKEGNGDAALEAPLDAYEKYILPDPDLLTVSEKTVPPVSKEELYANGTQLERTLEQFGVRAKVVDIHPGPVITRYDLSPAPGVRVQAIETLADDIALAMKAQSLRVLAPVPGKAAVGIEISNSHAAMVFLKEMILSSQFQKSNRNLPLALGKTTEGDSYITDLAAMPHLLIAGATGSGKSVCIHAIILSLLYHFKPDEVKLLLIDPKRLELPGYDGIPHLYDPAEQPQDVKVITQPKDVVQSLKKLLEVMDSRYKEFAARSVRNIEGYNEKARAGNFPRVPYIVVVIDELADLMVVVGREIEELIQRLAQMARAVGIHLILATQRPSVDVITGVIKANLPSRVAFQVLSKTDSRVILDSQGAEDLLGRGDMLFLATGAPKPIRLQGAFVSEGDVARVIQFIKEQNFKPSYEAKSSAGAEESIVDNEENRALLIRAVRVVKDTEKVSGDLLRADKEIGSKYDLALTLLKKKGLIEKPKDTNRWKIHFDRLDDFLAQVEEN